ncbi:superoxide dismutase [Flavobacterium sp. SUN052]|uniref:superoxide dismutase n=1 Tax=Flavobacterium sp. SUN052 TaxID=3002441 RepID=UPI00237E8C92|nr:superoxide dismutase [Flavobacterium sp. SUN052]MEC4005681.1 superoxide dismutase [Flavobacterium sp. SUN052]
MKKIVLLLFCVIFTFSNTSCKRKKYTEVVEVPLPSSQEKMTIGVPEDVKAEAGAFEIVKLPYNYDALAPNIDALTMEMHYSKHYLTYTNNLNKALAGTEQESIPIEEIFKKLDMSNADLRNNLGGYYNHTLFFDIMSPKAGGKPTDTLASAIDKDFVSFDNFKIQFEDVANKQFGSGWVWLVVDKSGKLQITSTPNQDNPLMPRAEVAGVPILALDLWEHAYYLNYQYKRKKYIDAFFNVINWKKVGEKYEEAINK